MFYVMVEYTDEGRTDRGRQAQHLPVPQRRNSDRM